MQPCSRHSGLNTAANHTVTAAAVPIRRLRHTSRRHHSTKSAVYQTTQCKRVATFQVAMQGSEAAGAASQQCWSHNMMKQFLIQGRNWRAVENFYIALVSGRASLSQLGLAPAGAAAASANTLSMASSSFVQQQQQQQRQPVQIDRQADTTQAVPPGLASPPQQELLQQKQQQKQQQQQQQKQQQQQHMEEEQQQVAQAEQQHAQGERKLQTFEKTTYKVHVAYLGSSFSGWMAQPGKVTVEGTLAAAIKAAGLADQPAGFHEKKRSARKAALRASRKPRATQRDGAGSGDSGTDAAVGGAAAGAGAGDAQCGSGKQAVLADQRQETAGAAVAATATATAAAPAAGREGSAVAGCSPLLPAVMCAGRTDAGVTAVGQVISFQTWQPVLQADELLAQINKQLPAVMAAQAAALKQASTTSSGGGDPAAIEAPAASADPASPPSCVVRVWRAAVVPREFHATFSASWRRYVYLMPLRNNMLSSSSTDTTTSSSNSSSSLQQQWLPRFTDELAQAQQKAAGLISPEDQALVQAAADVDPVRVNTLLQQLQSHTLNYYVYARDTPKGKSCDCVLHVARASLVHLPVSGDEAGVCAGQAGAAAAACQPQACLCVELVGDRFLRRMVRVLVATAVRESLRDAGPAGVLVDLMGSMDRNLTAAPAPGMGLCFAGVGYDEEWAS